MAFEFFHGFTRRNLTENREQQIDSIDEDHVTQGTPVKESSKSIHASPVRPLATQSASRLLKLLNQSVNFRDTIISTTSGLTDTSDGSTSPIASMSAHAGDLQPSLSVESATSVNSLPSEQVQVTTVLKSKLVIIMVGGSCMGHG